ncbi:MAG: hydrolase [Alphaproteobacteria bacterium]|nr:hydrolase [Alphaproteobacteria bacterium]|tara:strand:+ start:26779 stop:27219 length:441 start_codon:yes stop_codon:yes gene_type:complete
MDVCEEELDTLARTIYGEARGEGMAGMQAIANVIMNRVAISERYKNGYWWGKGVIGVCKKPWQFSCWNKGDVNKAKIENIDFDGDFVFAIALDIAEQALLGELEDITNGSTSYHADYVTPKWVKDDKPKATIGRHLFYHLKGTPRL